MALTADNTIFVYRDGDASSLSVAQYYMQRRGLDATHLMPIACSADEVLLNYATFQSEIENPILAALAAPPLSTEDIYVIVLGYNVPGGFIDGSDTVSAVSRIIGMKQTYQKREENFFYIRKVGTDFTDTDNDYGYIAGRIDAPSVKIARSIIDGSIEVENQRTVNGDFYVDPYFGLTGSDHQAYSNSTITYTATKAPTLTMPIHMTILQDPYEDVIFGCLNNDSFYWGGISDYATDDLFLYDNSASRVFFYNIDSVSAVTVRSTADNYWVPLVLQNGYMAAAGSMSLTSPTDLLNIDSFFTTLSGGYTLGEAFAYSLPRINSYITFVGDPLTTIRFPDYANDKDIVPNNFCSFFPTASPYSIHTEFKNIIIGDNCLTDSATGDRVYLSAFNFTLNETHILTLDPNGCEWSKTIPNALTSVRWFSPITNPDPCGSIPSSIAEGEIVNYDVKISMKFERIETSNNVYNLTLSVETVSKSLGYDTRPEGYIKLFTSTIQLDVVKSKLIGEIFNNEYNGVQADSGDFIFGQNGSSSITNTSFVGGLVKDLTNNGIVDIRTNTASSLTSILKAMAYAIVNEELTSNAFITAVLTTDVPTAVDLLYRTKNLSEFNSEETRRSTFKDIANTFVNFLRFNFLDEFNAKNSSSRTSITTNEALELKGLKVSREFVNIVGGDNSTTSDVNKIISDRNILEGGLWDYEATLSDDAGGIAEYHFELDVATDVNFSDIVYSLDSSVDTSGWLYEIETDNQGNKIFTDVPAGGVSYSFLNNSIRFKAPSDKSLVENSVYYFRFRQKYGSTKYAYITNSDIVI